MRAAGLLATTLLALGCGPAVQAILYAEGERPAPRAGTCDLPVYASSQTPPPELEPFGDIFAGDTGFTVACRYPTMLKRLQHEACALGAEALHVIDTYDTALSDCAHLRASMLRRRETE